MSAATEAPQKKQRTTLKDIYHERTNFQFIGHSRRWLILSGTLILISIVAFAVQGLNLGIDFEGGTEWQFTKASGSASVSDVRAAIDPLGLGDAKILIVGNDGVRVQAKDLSAADQAKVTAALGKYGGLANCDVGNQDQCAVAVKNVGPTWGDKVSSKALQALVVFFFVIALYLTFDSSGEWRSPRSSRWSTTSSSPSASTRSRGSRSRPRRWWPSSPSWGIRSTTPSSCSTRCRDNTTRLGTVRGDTYSSMVNRSLNQVLIRSINTSLVALLPVGSLLFVGT